MNVFINYSTLTVLVLLRMKFKNMQTPTGQLLAAMQVNLYELYIIY